MTLRAKLFFTVGLLFVIIALISFYLPHRLVEKDINNIETNFDKEFLNQQHVNQTMRQAVFANRIIDKGELMNSTLFFIHDTPSTNLSLNPLYQPNSLAIWEQAATMMSYCADIGFLQISSGGEPKVVMVASETPIYFSEVSPIGDTDTNLIAWFNLTQNTVSTGEQEAGLFIGIKLDPFLLAGNKEPPALKENEDFFSFAQTYYLYSLEQILDLPSPAINIMQRAIQLSGALNLSQSVLELPNYRILTEVWNQLRDARFYLKKFIIGNESYYPEDIIKKIREARKLKLSKGSLASRLVQLSEDPLFIAPYPVLNSSYSPSSYAHTTEGFFAYRQQKARIRAIVNYMSKKYITEFLGNMGISSPIAPNAPKGIAKVIIDPAQPTTRYAGPALLTSDIYFDHLLFDDTAYYEKFSNNGIENLATSLAVIDPKIQGIFVGNTLAFPPIPGQTPLLDPSKRQLITLGSNLNHVLEGLTAVSEILLISSDQRTISEAFDQQGNAIPLNFFDPFPLQEMFTQTVGHTRAHDTAFHYFRITPIPNNPLTVLVLTQEKDEIFLSLKDRLIQALKHTTERISVQLLSVSLLCLGIALIILSLISNHITKPIAILARAMGKIVKGNYSEIELPTNKGHYQEISILSNSFENMIKGLQDKEKIRGALNKVVSKEIAEEILKGNIHLGGEDKVITILFADIRHFTHMTEHLPPQDVINLLNNYMTKMSETIDDQGGVIDKYVGDEIMALYGAPLASSDSAFRAVTTALLMIEKLNEWNKERALANLPPVEVGIGIHTGHVVAGNMGAETRLNYTVLGSNVNLASRLTDAAGVMQILITDSTLDAYLVRKSFIVEEQPLTYFRGFSDPIRTFAVIGFRQFSNIES